jgi:hypothetical protein
LLPGMQAAAALRSVALDIDAAWSAQPHAVKSQATLLSISETLGPARTCPSPPEESAKLSPADAIRAQRQPDGTWLQAGPLPGRVWFDIDAPTGEPSKWLTLSGKRVLNWWDAYHQER